MPERCRLGRSALDVVSVAIMTTVRWFRPGQINLNTTLVLLCISPGPVESKHQYPQATSLADPGTMEITDTQDRITSITFIVP